MQENGHEVKKLWVSDELKIKYEFWLLRISLLNYMGPLYLLLITGPL